ncbi:hypothetical protein EI546_11865 [Aequorivita sp. H23M31]|uniref:Uncharacterized protein n=1 Tax=Aequorivita ciconiae TaxID=2494375 RepID=A0A410G542_9FLAO|nr:hypothetical protein [Aequorivita sp. H23M31]QAA82369.1 hypothetical protein EI546_11865 [Aequorivita sp. H23M31]
MKIDGTSKLKNKESFNFLNTETKDLAMILMDKKTVVANLFDKDFELKSTLVFDSPKHDNILGYKIIGNTYQILLSNNSKKRFSIVNINFDSKRASTDDFKFDFGDEKYLGSIHYNNQLYVLSANRRNDFIIRELADKGFSTIKTIPVNSKESNEKLLTFPKAQAFASIQPNLTLIDNRVPNSIEQTASENKLYQKDNFLYLSTEDEEGRQTVLYKIDLEDLTLSESSYEYPKGKIGNFKNYNSFILDDHIFQLGSSKEELKVHIKNFDNEIINEFYIEIDKPIDFINSPIFQEGGFLSFKDKRELEDISKFLRKVSVDKIGITGYKDGELYHFTIGGFREVVGGGGMVMPSGGYVVSGGGVPSINYSYNPTYIAYTSYSTANATFFNTHFDADFNYASFEGSENVFDKIKAFKKTIKFDTAEDVFIQEGKLYLSSYDSWDKIFKIVEM